LFTGDIKKNVSKIQKQTHVNKNGCNGNFKQDSVEQSCDQVNRRYETNGYNNQRNFVGYNPRVFQRNQSNYDQRKLSRAKMANLLVMNEVVMAIETILIDEMVSMFLIIDKTLLMCVEEVV
jgi:hypothetical protein